jgi:thiol-disulfide isomerase/thioredoxin
VRIRGGVTILAMCLSLTGCSLFGKKPAAPATPAAQRPSELAPPILASGDRARDNDAFNTIDTTPKSGFLAGQIKDTYNRLSGGALIQVVDLEDTREPKSAPIERQADDQGYFRIEGLRPRGHYQLIARSQGGDRTFMGVLVATPPNPRLTIWVREEPAGASGPNTPAAPTYPGKPEPARNPTASLEAPVKDGVAPATAADPADAGTKQPTPPTAGAPPAGPAQPTKPDASRIAEGGFPSSPRPPAANVPGPAAGIPPSPGSPKLDDPAREINQRPATPPPTPAPAPTSQAPAENTPVPSCQLLGNKLINFALYDYTGKVWEYRKDRAGHERISRLTLIDFWSSHCGPCLAAMPKLVELNQQYHQYGLDLVGIAYESGTAEQRTSQVLSVRGRYGVRYPTLLGDGSRCPVLTQFGVQYFPTLILLDENGEIVFRKEGGLDVRAFQELEFEIRRRLALR